jgi:hypothetical protein
VSAFMATGFYSESNQGRCLSAAAASPPHRYV